MVIVRGGGDLATGTICMLHQCGYDVLVLETGQPTAIRRKVSFSEAVYDGSTVVESVVCRRVETETQIAQAWKEGEIPLLIDPAGEWIRKMHPQAVIDAILAKKNLGTSKEMAPLTIALGPGFEAGRDVDYVIETKRGHRLGRVIAHGTAIPNTGVPGLIGGYGAERVIHAPATGEIHTLAQIGELVKKGQRLAEIGETGVYAAFDGVLRGMIRDGFAVTTGLKIADIDPRAQEQENCTTISDKARCIAGGVLQALLCSKVFPSQQAEGTWVKN